MGIARDQADMAAAIRDHHERLRTEKERRLARYDEAIRLLRECGLYTDNSDFDNKVIAFLAAEPEEWK